MHRIACRRCWSKSEFKFVRVKRPCAPGLNRTDASTDTGTVGIQIQTWQPCIAAKLSLQVLDLAGQAVYRSAMPWSTSEDSLVDGSDVVLLGAASDTSFSSCAEPCTC